MAVFSSPPALSCGKAANCSGVNGGGVRSRPVPSPSLPLASSSAAARAKRLAVCVCHFVNSIGCGARCLRCSSRTKCQDGHRQQNQLIISFFFPPRTMAVDGSEDGLHGYHCDKAL